MNEFDELKNISPVKKELLESRMTRTKVTPKTEEVKDSYKSDEKSIIENKSKSSSNSPLNLISTPKKRRNNEHEITDASEDIRKYVTNQQPPPTTIDQETQTDSKVSELEFNNRKLADENQKYFKTIQDSLSKIDKSIQVIKDLLFKEAQQHYLNVRKYITKNKQKLGQFIMIRQGAQFVEHWEDGIEFVKANRRLEVLSSMKDELEKQRKQFIKKRNLFHGDSDTKSSPTTDKVLSTKKRMVETSKNNSSNSNNPSNFHDHVDAEEALKLQLSSIKKEELDIINNLEVLERKRNIHIREIKRIQAEDASRFKNFPVLDNRYLLLNLLGKGGFSEVFRGFDLKLFQYVALKIHQLNKDWTEERKANYIKHAIREYNIHKTLDHSHIVKLYDVFEIDNNTFATVLEYIDGNDLDFLLKQNKTLSEKETRIIIYQIVSALVYLNTRKPPIIHYDLKPGNILLGKGLNSWTVKITDFGLSKYGSNENMNEETGIELTSQGAGTYWYLPPECFVTGNSPPRISSKVDVWSIGVIAFQCIYGKKPFGHNMSQTLILENNTILNAIHLEFPPKPPLSNELKSLIKRCLSYKKDVRYDVLQLSEDSYFKMKKINNTSAALLSVTTHSSSTGSLNTELLNSPPLSRSN